MLVTLQLWNEAVEHIRYLRIFRDRTRLTGRRACFDVGIEMAISESSFIGGWDFNATSEKKEKCMQLA